MKTAAKKKRYSSFWGTPGGLALRAAAAVVRAELRPRGDLDAEELQAACRDYLITIRLCREEQGGEELAAAARRLLEKEAGEEWGESRRLFRAEVRRLAKPGEGVEAWPPPEPKGECPEMRSELAASLRYQAKFWSAPTVIHSREFTAMEMLFMGMAAADGFLAGVEWAEKEKAEMLKAETLKAGRERACPACDGQGCVCCVPAGERRAWP